MDFLNLIESKNKHVLNLHFDNIYILYISNYELERIKYKINKIKLIVQYFKGVNGKIELLSQFNNYYKKHAEKKSKSYMKTVGAFGHVHSIINILKDAIENKYNRILILEPDIHFSINFNSFVNPYLQLNYKLLYLGASQNDWSIINKTTEVLDHDRIYNANRTCGTFAIGIDNSIFNEYLEILKNLDNPSDTCLHPIQQKYKNECFVTYPNLISCDVTKSTTAIRWRYQFELINKFRWFDNYDVDEKLPYIVKPNTIYKVIIEINYINSNDNCHFKISDDYGDVTPTINLPNVVLLEKKNKIIDNKTKLCEEYVIYIYTNLTKMYVHISNIYIDNIYFIECKDDTHNKTSSQLYFKQKISRYLNSKDNVIVSYYDTLLHKIKNS